MVTGKENAVDGDTVNIKENKHIYFGNWDFDTRLGPFNEIIQLGQSRLRENGRPPRGPLDIAHAIYGHGLHGRV